MISRLDRRVAAAAFAYVVVASLIATRLGTWTDEEYTLATTAHGAAYAFVRAVTYELQAPLYFVVEALWREADMSVWWARFDSILCIGAFYFVLARIGRIVAPSVHPLPFVAIVALNPYVVKAGFEIRLYAVALLLCGIMWVSFDAGFVSGSRMRARIGFACASIVAIYVQYFLGFMLAGFLCTLLVLRRWHALRAFALTCVPVVVAVVPLALSARSQLGGYETVVPPLEATLRRAVGHPWIDFIFPWQTHWERIPELHAVYWGAVSIAFACFLVARPHLREIDFAWIASAIGIELVYLALVGVLRIPLDDRYYVALYVPLAAAMYAVAIAVVRGGRRGFVAIFALTAVLEGGFLFTAYRNLTQPGDWRRVAAYLDRRTRPGDAIVVFAADAIAPLRRTYDGPVAVFPFPGPQSPDVYSVDRLTVHSQAQAERALATLGGFSRLWFVSEIRCTLPEDQYGCAYIPPAIAHGFAIRSTKTFYDNRISELVPLRDAARAKDTPKP